HSGFDSAAETNGHHGQRNDRKSMRKWAFWLAAIVLLIVLQATLRGLIGAYYYQIVILVGINIILAVSLNLINGLTGQFSIGHAGSYAIGGYTSAALVYYGGASIRSPLHFLPSMAQDTILLLIGLFAAAVMAGLAGLVVGIPSLRLRGGYLAVVTFGVGGNIWVFILNIYAICGSRGFFSILSFNQFFLGLSSRISHDHHCSQLDPFQLRTRLYFDPRRRDRRRSDGSGYDSLQGSVFCDQLHVCRNRGRIVWPLHNVPASEFLFVHDVFLFDHH